MPNDHLIFIIGVKIFEASSLLECASVVADTKLSLFAFGSPLKSDPLLKYLIYFSTKQKEKPRQNEKVPNNC